MGVALVYSSSSPSLAALERLAHTDSVKGLKGLWVHSLEVLEEDSLYLPTDALPPDWRRRPVPPDWHEPPLKTTQLIGNDWVNRGASLVLRVASVVVAGEYNYLLNPAHPRFKMEEVAEPQPFYFEERLERLL